MTYRTVKQLNFLQYSKPILAMNLWIVKISMMRLVPNLSVPSSHETDNHSTYYTLFLRSLPSARFDHGIKDAFVNENSILRLSI